MPGDDLRTLHAHPDAAPPDRRRELLVRLGRIEVALANSDVWEEHAQDLPAAVRQRLLARLHQTRSRESLEALRASVLEQLAQLEEAGR